MERDVYSGYEKLLGEEDVSTLGVAVNYAMDLVNLERFKEAKSLLLKTIPLAQRVLGDGNDLTLRMRYCYSKALYKDPDATLDDVREAVMTLEDTARIARRVMGSANPLTRSIEKGLRDARDALRAAEQS